MTDYKLTYFDMNGGRGEPIRIAFHAAGISFEDHRITFEEFGKLRPTMRFKCSPTMEIDSTQITQSNAMLRYVGKLANLYPKDDLQALYCDETLGAAEDVLHHIVRTLGLEGEALKQARIELADGWLTTYIRGFADLLARGGGKYFADNRLTIADLKIFMQVRSLTKGTLDHIPTDLVQKLAPSLVEHAARVAKDPIVANYYNSRS